MDPASISALLSGGSSLVSGLSGLFGGDGGASDAAQRALDQAREQYQQGQQAETTAARRNLALTDPLYQQSMAANRAYLSALGLPYITNDPVLSSMQHNADNYIAVGPDGTQSVVNTIPGYTGGNTPRPITGVPGPQQGQGGALNFSAPHGSPIGTVNGTTYYRRDEDSLMPYNWAGGTGFQQTPGYQFQMDQGIQARDRSAAARGMLLSGAQQKELTRFGQGTANQEYGTWLNRVGQVAGQAPQATSQVGGVYSGLGQAGSQSAGNLANLALTGGSTNVDLANRSQSSFNGNLSNIFGGLGSIGQSLFGNGSGNALGQIAGISQNIAGLAR